MKHILLTSAPDQPLTDKWNRLLTQAPFATHYSTPNYFRDPYLRGDPFAVLAEQENGEIAGVLTGIWDSDKAISGLFVRPQTVFAPDVDMKAVSASLLNGINELYDGRPGLVELFTWQPVPGFTTFGMRERQARDAMCIVVLDLSLGADALFAGFSQTRRNEIRKALKQDLVEVKELDTADELDQMYTIHRDWCGRKGNPVDTFEQMRTAVGQRENRRTFIAKANGKVIAGSFYRFCPGGIVEYAGNSSIPEYQKLKPNDLIGWHAIQWACEHGLSHFSMGGSHLFLRRFGGELMQTYRYRRDHSRLRLHDLREQTWELSLGAYKRLPPNVRANVKRVLVK